MSVLAGPQPLPPVHAGLGIRLRKENPFRACPKTVPGAGEGRGALPSTAGSSSVPWEGSRPRSRLVPGYPRVSQPLGAAGHWGGVPAHLQQVSSAQGMQEAHEPVGPWGSMLVLTDPQDILSLGSPPAWVGKVVLSQLCSHSLSVLCCSLGHRAKRLCWAGTGALQRSGCTWNCHTPKQT